MLPRANRRSLTEPAVFRVYVGTYTGGAGDEKSRGIYMLDLDVRSGKAGTPRLAGEATDPSFLAIHPSRKFLYAVSERDEAEGPRAGLCSGFRSIRPPASWP